MALLSGNELCVGAHYIIHSAEFKHPGSTTVLTTPLAGGNGSDGGEAPLVTNLFYKHCFSEPCKAGIGITAPRKLAAKNDNGASRSKKPGGAIYFTIL